MNTKAKFLIQFHSNLNNTGLKAASAMEPGFIKNYIETVYLHEATAKLTIELVILAITSPKNRQNI